MATAEKVRHRLQTLVRGILAVLISFFCFVNAGYSQQSYSIATCSGTPFNFIQPGAVNGTTYTWTAPVILPAPGAVSGGTAQSVPQSSVSQVLTNSTTAQATATYVVTTSSNTTFQLVVTVNPLPLLTSSKTPPAVCSGANFSYSPTATPATGTGFAWSRLAVTGISNAGGQGAGNPNEILNNTTINPITVRYSYTLSANGCTTYNEDVDVVINPIPFLSSTQTPPGICSGTTFNYTPTSQNANTFTWTRAVVAGIANGAGSGNTNISEVLVNTTLLPITVNYVYTLTNSSQNCSSNQQVVRVVVSPVPSVTPQTLSSCTGNTFLSSPVNVPEGTLYTWTNPVVTSGGAITGGSSVSVGQLYIGQKLTNPGSASEIIRYTVTPSSGSCVGGNFFVDVTVTTTANPQAVLSNPTPSGICSGANFNYTPASANATSFTWKRFYNAGISQGATNGSGSVNEPLTNVSTVPVTAFYAYTSLMSNGCTHTQTVPVTVNPPTTLNTTLSPVSICSNNIFSYAPTSATPGTSFNWSRAAVAGIINPATSGTGNPSEILVNATTLPVNVTYLYALNTPNGCTNTQSVVVTVNPTPTLTSSLVPADICSGTSFNYVHTSSVNNTSFSWSRAVVPNISNGQGLGTSNPSELLVNTSVIPVSVPYNYLLNANGCANNQVVSVIVNPTPTVANQSATICSNKSFTVSPANMPAGTQYTWGNPVVSPSNAVTGVSAQVVPVGNITQLLTNQTLNAGSATYTVTPIAGTCSGAAFMISVTVNPVPVVANQVLQPVCSGKPFNFSAPVVPAGTTYTWSSPVQSPLNSLTGASAQPLNQAMISQILASTNNLSDTATYSVTPQANGCAGAVFTVAVPVSPVPVVNNVIDTICTGSAFMISPTPVPANTTYTWPTPTVLPFGAIVGGLAQVNPMSTISQVLVNATTAPAQIVFTVTPASGNCAGTAFTVTEVVGNALAPFANRNAVICSNTAFDVTPATAPPNTTYTWNIPTVAPAGSLVGLSAQNSPVRSISQTLTNITNGADTVVYTIQPFNTGCKGNNFTATIRILPSPRATITGKPVICRYPVDTLSVSFTGTAPWTFTYNDGITVRTQSGITASPYTWVVPVTPTLPGRTLAITAIRDFACNSIDTSYFIQKINELPVGNIVSLHGNYICNNTIDTLFVSSVDSLGFQWTYNGNAVPGLISDTIATLTPGSYNAIMTNRNGCRDTAAVPLTLHLVAQPVVQFNYDSYCIDNIIRFTNLTDTANIGRTQWLWDFGDGNTSTSFHSTDTYTKAGKRHVKLTAFQLFCPAYSTTADSTLDIQFPIQAMRMPSVSAYSGQSTPLIGRNIPGYRYQWLPSRGIDFPAVSNPNFNYQVTQDYIINLISPAGCITPDSMLVRVFDDKLVNIMVPKSFTPNGDGINDILYPYLAGIKTFKYFKVYNRFGKLVFESTNYDVGWNGTWNGTPQPMAIYVWVSVGTANDGSLVEKRGQTLLLR